MPNIWHEKDPSPISSPEMIKLLDRQEKLKQKINKFREECPHDYETLHKSDGHDGYSWVDCEVTAWVHCKICGNKTYQKTGKINRY